MASRLPTFLGMDTGASEPFRPGGRHVDWIHLLFSSAGRLGRTWFLVAVAVLLGVFVAYEHLAGGILHLLTAWAVYAVLLFSASCVLSKRLHDRGRSGWWTALVLFSFGAFWPPPPHGVFGILFSLPLLWAAIELGARPGERGANRFGPPGA